MPRRAPSVLALLILLLVPLSGCMSGGETPPSTAPEPEVGAEEPTEIEATSPDDLTGGHLPHVHNYWGESDRVVVYQGPVDIQALSQMTFFNVFLRKDPSLGGTIWELPEGQTVYEGTGRIEITASWTEASITGLGMAYKPANMPETRDTVSDFMPLANGAPTTIEVTPEMTDMPHEAVSRWRFYFAADGTPALAQGRFELKVELVRMRDLMAFPGHPDMYEDTDRYVLADKDFVYRNPSLASFMLEAALDQRRDPIVPDKPVPMETRVLLVQLDITSATTAPVASQSGIDLYYRSADGKRAVAMLLESDGTRYLFGIPVEDSQVDSPYGDHSAWRFGPMVRQAVVSGFTCQFCLDAEVEGHVVITAYAVDPTGGQVRRVE